MKAERLMTSPVITVTSDTTVYEIACLLMNHRINSIPVINDEDQVIGIVSKDDLFLKQRRLRLMESGIPTLFSEIVNPSDIVEIYRQSSHIRASNVMSTDIVCVDVEDDVGEVAWLIVQRHVDMTPVLRNGRLAGTISRRDLLKVIAKRP